MKVFEVFAMVLMEMVVVLLKAVCNFVAVTCLRRRVGGGSGVSDGISFCCICDGAGCNVGGLCGVMLDSVVRCWTRWCDVGVSGLVFGAFDVGGNSSANFRRLYCDCVMASGCWCLRLQLALGRW